MNTISSFLTHDHRVCDEQFASLENAVASMDWEEAENQFDKFLLIYYIILKWKKKLCFLHLKMLQE